MGALELKAHLQGSVPGGELTSVQRHLNAEQDQRSQVPGSFSSRQ